MDFLVSFVQANRSYFDVAQAAASIINVFTWLLALCLVLLALRNRRIESWSIGPFNFRLLKEEAVVATAAASRAWQSSAGSKVDVPRIRAAIDRALTPETLNNLTGQAVLWVDDNPSNNELAVRALRKFGLDIEQQTSTDAGLAAFQRRKFDLVISDMGRGTDMRAGYDLLARLRNAGAKVPFFIFAGSDKPEFRREAAERGAQLSTNDMLELVDSVLKQLGTAP